MAKKPRTAATVQEKIEGVAPNGYVARSRQAGAGVVRDPEIELDRMEKFAAVCRLFCRGLTVHEIREEMAVKFGPIRREEPYTILSYAAARGWLEFRAPHHLEFGQTLREYYPGLADVDVAWSPMTEDVAQRAAQMLLRIVTQKVRSNPRKRECVRIGFAGGVALAHLARAFSDLLCRPTDGLPKTIVFHSVVAGFDPKDPFTDPNALFTYFTNRPFIQVSVEFLGLHAPAIVGASDESHFLGQREIKAAHDEAKKLDIIVTSGSDWKDEHSLLATEMRENDPKGFEKLRQLDVEGDLMWQPLAASGQIDAPTDRRALTMKKLAELPDFIQQGGSVLLMITPCAGCNEPKGRITRVILDLRIPFITHLVMDSLSAAEIVKELRRLREEGSRRRQ
jgi:DNA-binding transcriptional regulator LsrR (DeoR family)